MTDFDLLVAGSEPEGCLSAVAGARAGARTGLVVPPDRWLGGLLTHGGLAFVDRDHRTVFDPAGFSKEGLYGEWLGRAGVRLVGLDPQRGHDALKGMLDEAGVTLVPGIVRQLKIKNRRVTALHLDSGDWLTAGHVLDATPDGDVAELAEGRFAYGFREYGISRTLGVSPLPLIEGVTAEGMLAASASLAQDPALQRLKRERFGDRAFLAPDQGTDYVLLGPPDIGLAYQQWRGDFPFPFQADGFNVAMLGSALSSWNGLIYEIDDPALLLKLSRSEQDPLFDEESAWFVRFLREALGFEGAKLVRSGVYVRQTRHVLGTRRRLSLRGIALGEDSASVGTFCYYPDFRGFAVPPVPKPLVAHVSLEAGLFERFDNLAIAGRAAGFTPFAHALCRLIGYNVALGAGLAVAASVSDWYQPDLGRIRQVMAEIGALADSREGEANNQLALERWGDDPLVLLEHSA